MAEIVYLRTRQLPLPAELNTAQMLHRKYTACYIEVPGIPFRCETTTGQSQ